ncbi:MAG: DUF2288 domain-containing protein [Methylococcaceae bacterium]|nr:DUF2288 domain-containing protein [Methylococcaceae bacterium]
MSKEDINLETSQIPWHDLQRFFASGMAIYIAEDIDLVDVAHQFSIDNKSQVEQWLKQEKIAPVSDQQALKWFNENTTVWSVVIKPWILVQETNNL